MTFSGSLVAGCPVHFRDLAVGVDNLGVFAEGDGLALGALGNLLIKVRNLK